LENRWNGQVTPYKEPVYLVRPREKENRRQASIPGERLRDFYEAILLYAAFFRSFMAGHAGLEFFRVMTGIAPLDAWFRHILLRCQRHWMGLMAFCAGRNTLLDFPIVRHILMRVNLVAAFSRELFGPGGKVIERAVTLKADIPVPGWGRRSIRLCLRIRRLGDRLSCRKKADKR
jgi:hypothetical protein